MNAMELAVGSKVLITEQDKTSVLDSYYDTVTKVSKYVGPNGPTINIQLEKFHKLFPFTGVKIFYGAMWEGDEGINLSEMTEMFTHPRVRKLEDGSYHAYDFDFEVKINF